MGEYKPMYEPIPPKIPTGEFEKWIGGLSREGQAEMDMMVNYLTNRLKKYRLGRAGALELLARLIQLGLLGPGKVNQEWLKKRVRVI